MNISNEDKKFLELYSDSEYEKPSVTVDAVIFRIFSQESENYRKLSQKKLQVYLNKRQYSPFKNKYAIVGTFIDLQHELSDTMKLCVKNKVGLTNYYYEQLFTFGDKSRDPRTRVLSVSYMLLTNDQEKLTNGDWFDIEVNEIKSNTEQLKNGFKLTKTFELLLSNGEKTLKNIIEISNTKINLEETKTINIISSDIAFDHAKIILQALERLKNKLEYTDIIFNLLPEEFTLTELKQCYEVILNERLLDANFRRKTAKMVTPTNKLDTAKGHRTSQLFVHNPTWNLNNLD